MAAVAGRLANRLGGSEVGGSVVAKRGTRRRIRLFAEEFPSVAGEELFQQGWGVPLASNVVIVVRRESSSTGLLDGDKAFINDVLRERLEKIADEETASLQPQKSGLRSPRGRLLRRPLRRMTSRPSLFGPCRTSRSVDC